MEEADGVCAEGMKSEAKSKTQARRECSTNTGDRCGQCIMYIAYLRQECHQIEICDFSGESFKGFEVL